MYSYLFCSDWKMHSIILLLSVMGFHVCVDVISICSLIQSIFLFVKNIKGESEIWCICVNRIFARNLISFTVIILVLCISLWEKVIVDRRIWLHWLLLLLLKCRNLADSIPPSNDILHFRVFSMCFVCISRTNLFNGFSTMYCLY